MGLIAFQRKFNNLFKIKYLNTLHFFCNLSFSTGIFATVSKIVKVIPIRKKDSKLEVSNYKPISLLFNIDLFFKKLMHCKLTEFLDERQILYDNQFGS